MMPQSFCVAALVVLLTPISGASLAQNQRGIPNLELRVAARPKEDGKLGQFIHEFRLSCLHGSCEMTVITLNQCSKNGLTGKLDAPVIVQTYASNRLRISPVGAKAVAVEFMSSDLGGDAAVQVRFGFDTDSAASGVFRRVTSFSGGFSKYSAILGRTTTVEFVPLTGSWNSVGLDCAVLLPGVVK